MLDLVRHVAVHGFTKDQLYEAALALQDSSVNRRVEEPITPASMNMKVELVRNIIKALTDVRRMTITPWSGKLPQPRESLAMTLGDYIVKVRRGRRQVTRGTFVEALRSSPTPVTWDTSRIGSDQPSTF
jgi:hypothetical protein